MSIHRRRLHSYDSVHDNPDFTSIVKRGYEITRRASLADVSLERGDVLPDEAAYYIFDSWLEPVKDKKSDTQIARVSAIKHKDR